MRKTTLAVVAGALIALAAPVSANAATTLIGSGSIGAEPVLLFVGGTHLAATLLLWGQAMSQPYDGQTEWRQRFHMDENSVQRLGKSVIKAGVSLPFILLYALMPRPESASMLAPLVKTANR